MVARNLDPIIAAVFLFLSFVPSCHAFVPLKTDAGWIHRITGRPRSLPLFAAADMAIQRGCQFYPIYYDLVGGRATKENDSSKTTIPVVILHGGPGVPSNYLRPLEALVDQSRDPFVLGSARLRPVGSTGRRGGLFH